MINLLRPGLLRAGFGALVLGLNLMTVWYSLNITAVSTTEIVNKLIWTGAVVTFVGFAVIAVGIFLSYLNRNPLERAMILTAGVNVFTLGIALIIRASGYSYMRTIYAGAWWATGIGLVLIVAYCVVSVINSNRARSTVAKSTTTN